MSSKKLKVKNQKSKVVKQKQVSKIKEKKTVVIASSSGHVFRGRVVSVKLPQTVTVLVERSKMHPLYKKSFIRGKKYLVHDGFGVTTGDVVEIASCRPISKNKHFMITKVVGKDIEALISEELKEKAAEVIAEIMPEQSADQSVSVSEDQQVNGSEEQKKRKPKKEKKNGST